MRRASRVCRSWSRLMVPEERGERIVSIFDVQLEQKHAKPVYNCLDEKRWLIPATISMESTLRHCGSIVICNLAIADSFDKLLHSISRVRYRVRTLGFSVFLKRPVNLAQNCPLWSKLSLKIQDKGIRSIKADPEDVKETFKIVYILTFNKTSHSIQQVNQPHNVNTTKYT